MFLLGGDEIKFLCKSNFVVVLIYYDMIKLFFYVRKVCVSFRLFLVVIVGVVLCLRVLFDVVEMFKCRYDEIFSFWI